MARGLPLLFGEDEIMRLHAIAHTAAIQTGAKGYELDHVTAGIFRALSEQANRNELKARQRPNLHLVEG